MKTHSPLFPLLASALTISLFFSCTPAIEPPPQPDDYSSSVEATVVSSSSNSSSGNVLCLFSGVCTPIPAGNCFTIGGQVVEVCSVSVSSSSAIVQPSSSSIALSSSSSSLGKVLCLFGGACLSITAVDCSTIAGQVVQVCPVSSSSSLTPSSSSVVLSSSSSQPAICSMNGGTVKIGDQVWMKDNLNCNVNGSKCYDNKESNCATYGRLYDWATAMNLPASCNSSTCSSQVGTKHRGICPSGWHIPDDAEWDVLTTTVGGSFIAGKKLKAKNGWNDCGPSGSDSSYDCEDDYGFAALPGGLALSSGSFGSIDKEGSWWSATEYSAKNAYYQYMVYYYGSADKYGGGKAVLFSVRCLQD